MIDPILAAADARTAEFYRDERRTSLDRTEYQEIRSLAAEGLGKATTSSAVECIAEAPNPWAELARRLTARLTDPFSFDPGQRLAAILAVLDEFDWEAGDRQYALEKIDQIAHAQPAVAS